MGGIGYFNTPPQSEREYWIAKGILLSNGLTKLDAHNGVHMKPVRPSPYHFESKRGPIIAGLSVCIFIMALVTGTRLYLRFFTRHLQWGMDDMLMIPGLLMAIAYPALQIAMVVYGGAGKHIYDVSYDEYYYYKWLAAIASIDFFVCVGVVKMSITVFNMRLTSMSSRSWKIANWTFFSMCLIYTLVAFFLNIFQCLPAVTTFDIYATGKLSAPPKCVGISEMNTILRVINIVLDYCLLSVPVLVLWNVQMSRRKKGRLFAVFSIGALACIGSVMTLVAKSRLKSDALWNYTGILGWSLVELVFGVLAASLPTLSALIPSAARSRHYQTTDHPSNDRTLKSNAIPLSYRNDPFSQRPGMEADHVGIIRQDEIELKYSTPSDRGSEDHRVGLFGYEAGKKTIAASKSDGVSTSTVEVQPGETMPSSVLDLKTTKPRWAP